MNDDDVVGARLAIMLSLVALGLIVGGMAHHYFGIPLVVSWGLGIFIPSALFTGTAYCRWKE